MRGNLFLLKGPARIVDWNDPCYLRSVGEGRFTEREGDFTMFHYSLNWSGLHPLIVHIPIILLLAAPLLIIVGVGLSGAIRRPFLGSAFSLMALGTAMTYVAVASGELATKTATFPPGFNALLFEHRALAETTRDLFSILTVVFATLLFAHKLLNRELDSWVSRALFAVFLIFYGTGAVSLIDTALKGNHIARVLGSNVAVTANLPNKGGN